MIQVLSSGLWTAKQVVYRPGSGIGAWNKWCEQGKKKLQMESYAQQFSRSQS